MPYRLVLVLLVLCLCAAGSAQAIRVRYPPLVGPFDKADYPLALIDRPLTLPAGMVEGEVGFSFVSRRFDAEAFSVFGEPIPVEGGGVDDWLADVGLRVGITDRVEVGVATAFSLDHVERGAFQGVDRPDSRANLTSWQRVVPLRLSVLALDTEALDTVVRLTLPFVAHSTRELRFARGGRFTLENTDGRVLPEVLLDALIRWRLTDWLWLRAGENLFSVTTGDVFATFAFDFGVGVQPHEIFALTLDSRIASVTFDGSGNDFSETLADRGTIDLEGVLSPVPWFDLVGTLVMPDVDQGFDDYLTRVGFRIRL